MIRELDCVRLTQAFSGADDGDRGGIVTMPAGSEGCAIEVWSDACMVEFTEVKYDDKAEPTWWQTTILTIPNEHLIKYWDAATKQMVA